MADRRFTIIFKKAPDYRIYPGDVAYGGPLPNGEGILMHICSDHAATPNYVQHAVDESGNVDASVIADQAVAGDIERELLCGISMSLQQAKRVVSWLTQHINTIEGNRPK